MTDTLLIVGFTLMLLVCVGLGAWAISGVVTWGSRENALEDVEDEIHTPDVPVWP